MKNPNHEYLDYPKPKVFEVFDEDGSRKELASNFRKLRKNETVQNGDFQRWLAPDPDSILKSDDLFLFQGSYYVGRRVNEIYRDAPTPDLKRFFYRRVKPYDKKLGSKSL